MLTRIKTNVNFVLVGNWSCPVRKTEAYESTGGQNEMSCNGIRESESKKNEKGAFCGLFLAIIINCVFS